MLSIIIPVYNRKTLVPETIDSILNQTRNDWECIIVDDHSDDGTDRLLESYTKQDSRLRSFRRPDMVPKGHAACRNYGLTLAQGEYVYFFDSDDLLAPEFIATYLPYLEKDPNLDFVNFRFFRFAASPKRIIRTAPAKPPEVPLIEAMAGLQMPVGTQCFLWRKSLLDRVPEKWRPGLFFGEDQEYYFRLLHEARGGIALDEPILFFYRRNRNGLCYRLRHDRRILDDSYIVYKSKVETALRYGDGNAVQEALSKRLRKQMRLAFRFGDLEYLARFLQLAELLTVSDKEKKKVRWMKRHPFLGLCRYRPLFLLEGFLTNLFSRKKVPEK
ncbi:MAG: glycosyltransferase family 2 protein [Thermoguttaceae bacterium]|jgi:glycosyltransferase involved in cell wall biosynthesis